MLGLISSLTLFVVGLSSLCKSLYFYLLSCLLHIVAPSGSGRYQEEMKDIENGSHPIDANKNFPSIKATTANDLVDSSPLLWNKVFSSCQCEEGITMFYEFHDSTIQKEFIYFKSYQFGKRFYTWCVASFITFLFSAYFAIALLDNPSSFLLAIFCFTYLFTIPLLWLLSFVKQRQILLSDHVVCAIENAYMLSTTLSVGLIVIFRALNGPCASIAFLKIWTCAPLMKFKYLAADIPAIVIFIPLLCSITLPSINSLSLLFAYLWAIFVPIFAISYLDAVYAMPWFVVIYIVVVLVHIVISATQIQLFRYFRKIEALQQQRELDAQRQANEMRGLIGKLAHDIRTVRPILCILHASADNVRNMIFLKAFSGI